MKHQKKFSENYVRAKKHLGQHFLKDRNIAQKIASNLDYQVGNTILEIGPGTGILSREIVDGIGDAGISYVMVELDRESVDYLQQDPLYNKENITLLNKDVIGLQWPEVGNKIELIGNLPYNISSPIFFKVLENVHLIYKGVFMVQKEVAHRICSMHGSKTYGILSVLMQSMYNCRLLFDVHPQSFIPPPKVMSSVFLIERKDERPTADEFTILKSVVKKSFNNRRKMLRNTINDELCELGDEYEKYLTLRPEQLSVSDFFSLAASLSAKRNAV